MSRPSKGPADASSLAVLDADMDRYLVNKRRRLRVIAAALASMAALLAAGHLREHAGAAVLVSSRVDDLLAGYPIAAVLALIAATVSLHSRAYRTQSS